MLAILIHSALDLTLSMRQYADIIDVRLGIGRHTQHVDPLGFETIFIIHYTGELLFLWAIAMVKGSILAFYWRIWKVSNLRIPVLVVGAAVITWLLASVGCFISRSHKLSSNIHRLLRQSSNVRL